MKIIELKAENVKRLTAVTIKPDGSLVVIGGQNGQGKSSVLDSIFYALAGKGALPPKPVRHGEKEATITLNLGDFIVTRIISPDGSSKLKLTGKDGGRYGNPQTILDALVGNLSFDPLAFSRMDPRKQVDTLKALVGLDFSEIDRKKVGATEDRVIVGREVKQLQGQLAGMPQHADAPAQEVNVSDLMEQYQAAQAANARAKQATDAVGLEERTVAQWEAKVKEKEMELEEAKRQVGLWRKKLAVVQEAAAKAVTVDVTPIMAKIASADAENRKVRENASRARTAATLKAKEEEYAKWTRLLEEFDQTKQDALAAAKFPVAGLSFDETGVLVAGMPFQQASAAEQLKVSVAMGLSLNPKLKVLLVRDGSLLDEKSLATLAAMAEEAGAQVWVERVSDGDTGAIIIEDGEVLTKTGTGELATA